MPTKNLLIKNLCRWPSCDSSDLLEFQRGINVIVGKPNTGKTQWLSMLNYLMGHTKSADKVFDSTLVEKYEGISAEIEIQGEIYKLERRWKEAGNLTKVFVNDTPVQATDFSEYLLKLLNVPVLHYPSGNPYGRKTWPQLSWRSLMRHIYRKQNSWTDIAAKQPEGEQHACIMLFLGIAEYLFSEEYGNLVKMEKEIAEIEANKKQFLKLLTQISQDLLNEVDSFTNLTPEAIQFSIDNINQEMDKKQKSKEQVLKSLQVKVNTFEDTKNIEYLSKTWESLQQKQENIIFRQRDTNKRLIELEDYKSKISEEIERISRAKSAGEVFTGFKVTHCPACQRIIKKDIHSKNECYVCHQSDDNPESEMKASSQRIDFEYEQLQAEFSEVEELIGVIQSELDNLKIELRNGREQESRLELQLRPVRQAVTAILPPELSAIDIELGELQERKRQLERIQNSLDYKLMLQEKLEDLEKQTATLEAQVEHQRKQIDYENAAKELAEHMSAYLKILNKTGTLWTQGEIGVQLRDRDFSLTVNNARWSNKLGATLTLYFLMAYNFGLLKLSNHEQFHYPGLTILDLPAQLDDGTRIKEEENIILEPFIELIKENQYQDVQVIATGSQFIGLQGAHRIELHKVWT